MKNLLLLTLLILCIACEKDDSPLTIESYLNEKSVHKIKTNPSGSKVFFLSSTIDDEISPLRCSLPLIYQLSCTDGSKTLYFEDLHGVADMAVDEECNLYACMGSKLVKFTPPQDSVTIKTSLQGFSSIITDEAGEVWAGTYGEGLYRYNGINWSRYSSHNSNLTGNIITKIAIGKNNDIWLAVSGDTSSVSYVSEGSITSYKWKDYVGTNVNIQQMAVDKDGNAWILYYSGGAEKLVKFSKTGIFGIQTTPVLENQNIAQLKTDYKGDVYLIVRTAHGSKLYVNNGLLWNELKVNTGETYIYDATLDSQGNLWLGTQNGIVKTTVQVVDTN